MRKSNQIVADWLIVRSIKGEAYGANVSRRVFLTLPDGVADDLERWAEAEGNKAASLAGFLVEQAVRQAKEEGKIPAKNVDTPKLSEVGAEALSFLKSLIEGQKPTDGQIGELAHLSDFSEEQLIALRNRLFQMEAKKWESVPILTGT